MVSIITPTHKKMPFWELTVLSVLSQECEDWEWIVLDNSKTPYFRYALNNLLEKYPRYKRHKDKIKIYELQFPEVNIGRFKNFCVEKTTCSKDEFVLLLDHDDILMSTIVKDIEKCREKMGNDIDYITSDCPIVSYFQDHLVIEKIYEHWLEPIPCEDFSIEGINFELKNILSAKRVDTLDLKDHMTYIAEHPRIIKKKVLQTETCKFHEECTYAEDTVQRIMLGWFHKGVYIPKQEIFCIHYRPNPEDSRFIDCGTYLQFHDKRNEINELYQKIDKLHSAYRALFPNVTEIKIPHFNPDEE